MSFKYFAEKVTDNHYVLPKIADMKCDVHAYLSEKLYQLSEDEMWDQAMAGASYDGVTGVYIMPDCHTGFSVPIGSVIVTDKTIIQASVGYDVSCGILIQKVNLSADALRSRYNRERLITEIEKRVASGVGSNRPKLMPAFTESKLEEIFRFGAKALGFNSDVCERAFLPVSNKFDSKKIPKAYEKALPQLGSSGSNNHFSCEVQIDKNDGSVWAMTHCGSRGLGYQLSEYFFYEGAKIRNLASNRRGLSWLYDDEALGREYTDYHNAAANYAIANRFVIASSIQEALQEVYGATAEVFYDISHNLFQKETLVLPDGSTKEGYVHRKGATRAMPAKHPDLIGTKWFDSGHPCLIAGSIKTGAAILKPLPAAHDTACSVNHGSGRALARGKAKKSLAHKQDYIDADMHDISQNFNGVTIDGIVTASKHIPLDECDESYKALDDVLSVLTENGIAEITHRLYPVLNVKG